MLILDRFHFSSAVVTPVKYDHSNYLTGSFAKKVWQEKLTNAGFSNPHPRFIADNFLGICCRHRLWLLWLLNHYVVLIGQVFAKHSGGINHIEAETKWPAFCRQHFPTYFLEWKLLYFYSNFSEICSKGPINNRPALSQKMDQHWSGNMPLSEPMMVLLCLLVHIWVPQSWEISTWRGAFAI